MMLGIEFEWKWSVDGIEGFTKSGTAPSHAAGVKAAERAIDKALAPKRNALAGENGITRTEAALQREQHVEAADRHDGEPDQRNS